MRLVGVVALLLVLGGPARADRKADKALGPYAGKIVISPDTPPTTLDELPAFLAANKTQDDSYDLIKGPPWPLHLVAVLAKDPGGKKVSLVFADKADKALTPIETIEVSSRRRIVIAKTEATVAAGFEAGKTYVVRVLLGKTVLARAELRLRD